MKIDTLVFASHNKGKILEIEQMLKPLGIAVKSALDMDLPDIEETGTTFAQNALLKAQAIAKITGLPCIADDSGLCVDALNGAPGIYSARYAPNRDFNQAMDKLLMQMEQSPNKSRKAHFSCVIALVLANGTHVSFEGRIDGKILERKSGNSGFGYDPLFSPDGYECSFADMSQAQKNAISHRGRAIKKLEEYLKKMQKDGK